MVVKKSSKNQIAIPKAILERAGLKETDVYFDVQYNHGHIVLTPLQFEEKIPQEIIEQFESQALKRKPGDKTYRSMEEAIKSLRSKSRH